MIQVNCEIKTDMYKKFAESGLNEDKNSMEFCENNDIYYIKYCEKGKEQFFLDSDNTDSSSPNPSATA